MGSIVKPTWVFIVGTYRTGSTTQYLLTEAIVKRTGSGKGLGYEQECKLVRFDEAKYGRYLVAKVFKYLPETSEQGQMFLEEKRLKAIGTTRDPRDVIVSMRERSRDLGNTEWSFEKTVTRDFPVWLGQFNRWADLGKGLVLVTRFEDMIVDLEREVYRIARHLSILIVPRPAMQIASDFALSAQKHRKAQFLARKNKGTREHPMLPSIPGWKFGTAGHWPEWLAPAEVALVEEHAKDYMERWGYRFVT